MGLLGVAGLGGELPRRRAEVLLAVLRLDALAGRLDGLVGEVHRIGAHVGDEAALVEGLGGAHRLAGRETQLAIRLLLQGAGGEGGHRLAHGGLGLHLLHPPRAALHGGLEAAGLLLAQQLGLAAGLEGAGVLVEIGAAGDALAAHVGELGLEGGAAVLQLGLEIPVTAAAEGAAGPLPLHQQAHRHRLHPAGGEPPGHLLPEERREGVAHEAIEDAARLLGVHQLHVELARVLQGAADRLLGDLVEDHAPHGHLGVEQLAQVPADALPLPILVRGQQEAIGALEGVLELLDHLFLVLRHHVERSEVVGGVHAEVRPLLALLGHRDLAGVVRQIAHVAHRGLHPEFLGQEGADGAGLGGAFDDHQCVGHTRRVDTVLFFIAPAGSGGTGRRRRHLPASGGGRYSRRHQTLALPWEKRS